MENFFIKNKWLVIGFLLLILVVSNFFDKGLAIGLALLIIMSGITFFVLHKLGFKDKKIYLLFLIVMAIRLGTTLFMYYGDFQPFSGGIGDYLAYQKSAVEASQCFRQGDFSIKNISVKYPDFYTAHCYPVIVGSVYALTLPDEIIGLMLNVWFVAITIIFVYLIILEIEGLAKNAFIIGLIIAVYPSYIFNSGLLLKDALEICLTILALFFVIKIVKKFSWIDFLVLYLALIGVTNFRFYIGYALIATLVFSWFLFSKMDFKKKIVYGIIFIAILGFIPQIAANQGYFGINSIRTYLNYKMVAFYRQVAYNPAYSQNVVPVKIVSNKTVTSKTVAINPVLPSGTDSSFTAGSSPVGYIKSFIYVLLGPLPWQIKNMHQALILFETFPWYLLLFFVVDGIIICFRKRIKEAYPLLIFSIMVLVVIAIFDSNFGLIVRIRIPAFISLLCFAPLGFNEKNIIYKYLNKIYEKIFGYGRSWIYRFKHS